MTQPFLLTVHLEKLTYGGDAMGRLEHGRAVAVGFAYAARFGERLQGFKANWTKPARPMNRPPTM